jgi:hypothetical protein
MHQNDAAPQHSFQSSVIDVTGGKTASIKNLIPEDFLPVSSMADMYDKKCLNQDMITKCVCRNITCFGSSGFISLTMNKQFLLIL